MPDEHVVPEGWAETTLGAIGQYLNGRAFKTSEWSKTGRPIIRIQDLTGSNSNPNFYEGTVEERHVVRPGDLLISWSATLGAYIWDGPEAVLNQHIFKVESKINKKFHYHLVRECLAALDRNTHGSGMVHVTKGIFNATPVAIPTAEDVQSQIAALIDSLEAKQQSSVQHLASARQAIKRFRQAVLAAACSGRLTTEWRECVAAEPADRALERKRLADRQRLGMKYREPHALDSSTLPQIPSEWCWATLPELGELGRGKSKHRPRNEPKLYDGGNYPFIQTGDIARASGRIVGHTQTYNETGLAQSRLWPERTVCITIAANIADSALLTYPACFPDSVVGFIADETIVLPEYLEFFIRTARRDLAAFAPATAQANINLAILSELAVALPSVEEQHEIVRRVEELLALAESLERRISAMSQSVERSAQAVLAKAFRGDLLASNLNGDS
jgi:type I restriction enzyme, S subunit